eukprot:TRINITY_DN20079_c0_g1_i1.p1 TRINITY_DN20079_c0_g1~~TRINITY_DN20079_c0_g1_i1.p1  ORF type:complete len:511 (+),score=74.90 TRINITY_DN20079_c0_g1_i1:91-1623(+)
MESGGVPAAGVPSAPPVVGAAAGSPSARLSRARSGIVGSDVHFWNRQDHGNPAAKPSASAQLCLAATAPHSSRDAALSPGRRLGCLLSRGPAPRERTSEFASDKQETHYAFSRFGVQPDIDNTFKRFAGDFSPGRERKVDGGHGIRSTSSDQFEALKAFRTFGGVATPVEVLARRGRGACSPRMRDGCDDAARRSSYVRDCSRYGNSDIDGICRLAPGGFSPRQGGSAGSDGALSPAIQAASGFVAVESHLSAQPQRTSRALSPPSSGSGGRGASPSASRIADASWAQSTCASRARHARDLSEVKLNLHEKFMPPSPAKSGTTPISPMSTSAGTSSQCTHSCRLASTKPSLAGVSSTTGSLGYAQSHRSYRLSPGEVLAELKQKELRTAAMLEQSSSRASLPASLPTSWESPSWCAAAWKPPPVNLPAALTQGLDTAGRSPGAILAKLRASQSAARHSVSSAASLEAACREAVAETPDDDILGDVPSPRSCELESAPAAAAAAAAVVSAS